MNSRALEALEQALTEGRQRSLEYSILQSAEASYRYARDVIKGRWREAEETILTDNSGYEKRYLTDVLKNDVDLIRKVPRLAANYAAYVMKSRWPEVEPSILLDGTSMCTYVHGVLYEMMGDFQSCDPEEVLSGWIDGKNIVTVNEE